MQAIHQHFNRQQGKLKPRTIFLYFSKFLKRIFNPGLFRWELDAITCIPDRSEREAEGVLRDAHGREGNVRWRLLQRWSKRKCNTNRS
jgi:hypothetical protein